MADQVCALESEAGGGVPLRTEAHLPVTCSNEAVRLVDQAQNYAQGASHEHGVSLRSNATRSAGR
ncbi:UNVERIFIED_ORG: hypothetical protein M2193_002273 [Bradyrhizobium japonicum]|jgi:hypothetical protein|uniref:Uncharacterized protein n=1 Tax=Bradyrhizobium diazoefficiens TaxID=1355477 RepID=A0A810CYB2_9BRAD|nr:hypothetical protein XF1B_69390 [Bradyrhizobium diazoefficiens]BCE50515.1 hypothetical protein XF4B_68640 [Bradyrhizobium diazoefficiens]BCE94018.1 hypothetical protein XF10B_68160 [Bradyrhizobium diazoefficiens]BCF28959.1 hypothetical protein XF14B_69110 [Bradyrhizobium diazoefficiens]